MENGQTQTPPPRSEDVQINEDRLSPSHLSLNTPAARLESAPELLALPARQHNLRRSQKQSTTDKNTAHSKKPLGYNPPLLIPNKTKTNTPSDTSTNPPKTQPYELSSKDPLSFP